MLAPAAVGCKRLLGRRSIVAVSDALRPAGFKHLTKDSAVVRLFIGVRIFRRDKSKLLAARANDQLGAPTPCTDLRSDDKRKKRSQQRRPHADA